MCARVLFVLVYGVKQINALICLLFSKTKIKIKCKQRSKLSMKDNFLDNAS